MWSFRAILVDGADHSASVIPHFPTLDKSEHGRAMKVRCIWLLNLGSKKQIHLFSTTEEHQTGANSIVENFFVSYAGKWKPHHFQNVFMYKWIIVPGKQKQVPIWLLAKPSFAGIVLCCGGWITPSWPHPRRYWASFKPTSNRFRSKNSITLQDLHDGLIETFQEIL